MKDDESQDYDTTDLDRLHAAAKREKPTPQPGREPVPVWVFIASMAAVLLGGGYAGGYVGNFSFENNSPFRGEPTDSRPIEIDPGAGLSPMEFAMKKGATAYGSCQACHGVTGTGQPGAIPPLAGSEWVLGGTERIARVVLHGLQGPVKVKGATYNSAMTPFGSTMSDKDISYVLTYIRNSWGNKATMVTPEMVAKVREATASHAGPWTEPTLEEFKDKNIPGALPDAGGAAPAAAPAPAP